MTASDLEGRILFLRNHSLTYLQKLKLNTHDQNKSDASKMDDILARLRACDLQKDPSQSATAAARKDSDSMDKLLANLNGQNQALKKQQKEIKDESDSDGQKDDHSSGSDLFTPATDSFDMVSTTDAKSVTSNSIDAAEMLRVKQELAAAKSMITRQEQELAETRKLKHTMEQAVGPPSEVDFGNNGGDISEQTISHLQSAFNASARPFTSRSDSWHPQEDSRSDNSDHLPTGGYNRGRTIWHDTTQPIYAGGRAVAAPTPIQTDLRFAQSSAWNSGYGNQGLATQDVFPNNQRVFSGPTSNYTLDGRFGSDVHQANQGMRRSTGQYGRPGSGYANRSAGFGNLPVGLQSLGSAPVSSLGMTGPLGYQPRPIGSPLSPSVSDYSTGPLPSLGSAWGTVRQSCGRDVKRR